MSRCSWVDISRVHSLVEMQHQFAAAAAMLPTQDDFTASGTKVTRHCWDGGGFALVGVGHVAGIVDQLCCSTAWTFHGRSPLKESNLTALGLSEGQGVLPAALAQARQPALEDMHPRACRSERYASLGVQRLSVRFCLVLEQCSSGHEGAAKDAVQGVALALGLALSRHQVKGRLLLLQLSSFFACGFGFFGAHQGLSLFGVRCLSRIHALQRASRPIAQLRWRRQGVGFWRGSAGNFARNSW